jgi:hypothetical protein
MDHLMRKRTRCRYSEVFRAAALAALDANAGNIARTARELGIRRKTLEGWAKGRTPTDPELRHQKRIDLLASSERLADALAGGIVKRVERGKADVKDMALAFGITVDKLLLLRGQPTAISKSESDTRAATLDLSQLTKDDLLTLLRLQEKASGRPPLPEASDLANPVIVTDDEAAAHAAE